MNIVLRVTGVQDVKAAARRFEKAANGGLQRRLVQSVRQEGTPALAEVKQAWRGVDVTSTRGGGSSSGLRGRVAAATKKTAQPRGVRFEVDPGGVDPAYGKSLTYGLDGLGRWRHPVWGNPRVWTQQTGQEVFFKTLRGHASAWEAGLGQVVTQVAREIEG